MRPLEILLLLLIPAGLALWAGGGVSRAVRALPYVAGGAMTLLLLHLVFEGGRWQMVPAYGLTLLLAILALRRWLATRSASGKSRPRLLALLPLLLLWLPAAALPWLMPVPRLPVPDGPYAVGTTIIHLVDDSRREQYGDDPTAPRELMIQLWYPAAPGSDGDVAPYIERVDLAAPVLAESLDLPSFALNHLALARPNGLLDAPPAGDGPFPAILFSHGIAVGFRSQNTLQMEMLASHGYVVVGIDHTYGGGFTVLPGERVILYARDKIFPSGSTNGPEGMPLVATWAADQALVIDYLQQLQTGAVGDGRLAGRLDLDHIGVYGHSTGGGAAAQLCGSDPRCTAVLLLDGWLEPTGDEIIGAGLDRPVMALSTTEWLGPENAARGEQLLAATASPTYDVRIAGTAHYDFSDLPLLSPLAPALGLSGELDGPYTTEIVSRYLLAFFDTYLKEQPDPLLTGGESPYPEVTVNSGE